MPEPLLIRYHFRADDGTEAVFPVELDPDTLRLPDPGPDLPGWTHLGFRQCPNCTLDPAAHPQCPAAAHLHRLVRAFDHLVSHSRADVEVFTTGRTSVQNVSMQQGIGALMGLIMATSGCPLLVFFRPMARFHLPFADQDETIYRAASAYLLADHFRVQATGGEPDRNLEGLSRIYREVHVLNRAMADRIKAAARTDASLNAIVHLDMFALMLPLQVSLHLSRIRTYFKPYLASLGLE